MKVYILSDRSADLEILTKGGLKPEFYIRKNIFLIFSNSKQLNKDPVSVPASYDCSLRILPSGLVHKPIILISIKN